MCYHSTSEWAWERWQLRGNPHSTKLKHYSGLTIWLFSVKFMTFVRGVLYLCRNVISVFNSSSRLSKNEPGSNGNQEVLCFPQSSSITEASPTDFFSIINRALIGGNFPLDRDAVSVFCSFSRGYHRILVEQGLATLQRCSPCWLDQIFNSNNRTANK